VNKRDAGRIGGLQTFFRYGREGLSQRGRLGGRPRALTLKDVERQFSEAEENKKKQEEVDTPRASASLKTLRQLWRQRSTAGIS